MTDLDLAALSTEAFVYGFPLVLDLDQVQRYVNEDVGANAAAPFNSAGDVRPVLRMYEPGPAVLDGTYQISAITRS